MDRYGRKVQWDVKRSVYVASAFYLFYYGGKACLFPFLTLYFRQIGLSASQTGLALGIKAFIWFCVSPIWMAITQRVKKTRTVLCYSIFVIIGSNLALTLLPPADPQQLLNVCLNESPPFSSVLPHDSSTQQLTTTLLSSENATEYTTSLPLQILSTTLLEVSSEAVTAKQTVIPTTLPLTETTLRQTENVATEKNLATTTSEELIVTVTEITPFKMAKRLLPMLEKNDVSSDDYNLISDFIEQEEGTKDWPEWKQAVLHRLIRNLLEKDEGQNSAHRSKGFGGSHFGRNGRRRSRWFEERKKRSSNENKTSSILDSLKSSINLTSISEKKDAALKKIKSFAKEITPYLSSNSSLFWCVIIILAAGELLSAPVEHVSDNSLYNLLDELDSLSHYGKHRVSALVGAAMCGITASIIVYFSPCYINGTINRFHIHFYLFALMLGISFMLAPFYPSYDPASNSTRSRVSRTSFIKCSTCTLMICSSCRHFLLFVTIFIVGITQAPMQNFMLWMIQDMEGSSELVYGSFVSANALCAMVSSLLGQKMIKVLKPCSAALISLISIAIQLVLYAFMPNPWVVLPLQLMNITGLSFLWTIVSHHTSTTMSSAYESSEKISSVHVFARASQQRRLHATYVGVYQGLAFSFGSIFSGFLYDYMQGRMAPLLVGSGILVAAWGLMFATYQCCCWPKKVKKKYSHLVSDSDSDTQQAESRELTRRTVGKNGEYYNVRDGKKRRRDRKKRATRFPIDTDSNTSDSDEHDWLKATLKKDSRML